MSRPGPQLDREVQRRGIRRLAVIGGVLCLPLVVSAWLVLPAGFDVVLLVLPFVYVAGVLVLAFAATRAWRLRSDRLLPLLGVAVGSVVLATVLFAVWPPDQAQVALEPGRVLAPVGRALHLTYFYLLVGAPWQFGLFLFIGVLGAAVTRRRSR